MTTTKAAHTPGPWLNGGPDDSYIFVTDQSGKETRIAEIIEDELDSEFGYLSTDEANANARLIAAAPELLAVLERAIPWLGKMIADGAHNNSVLPRDCEVTLGRAEALVQKVKGGQ